MANLFETHAHYDSSKFERDRHEVLAALPTLPDFPVTKIINVGTDKKSSEFSIKLSQKYEHVYAAVGCHPTSLEQWSLDDIGLIAAMCENEGVVAVGETGLDYYHDNVDRNVQKGAFIDHIRLAAEFGLPVIVHSREACEDTYNIINEYAKGKAIGIIHCFPGSVEVARRYVSIGFYLGVGGVVTYANSRKLKEVVSAIPIEHLVIETDCPYLTPRPIKPSQRNDSSNLRLIISEIAAIKQISVETAAEATFRNAENIFLRNSY